jgi:dihydroneopterin aldolase
MKMTTGYIFLKNVRFHAHHGVLEQERVTGGDFLVSLRMGYPLEKAMESDCVDDTLNYASVYEVVKREIAVPSALLEHVAGRIVKTIRREFPGVVSIDLMVTKCNPPMGADCDGAGVELHIDFQDNHVVKQSEYV